MVVPMENIKSSAKSKKYIGNGLVVRLAANNSTVHVIGNECRIKIDSNEGTLKVIGNSCQVQVRSGNGEIVYNGNEGRIRLGPHIDEKNVTYIGNEGKITKELVKSDKEKRRSAEDCGKPKTKTQDVPLEKTKKNGGYTLNVISKSHKHFSLSESVFSITVPSVILVPQITESVIKMRRVKK